MHDAACAMHDAACASPCATPAHGVRPLRNMLRRPALDCARAIARTAPGSDQFHKETGTSNARTESPRRGDRNKSDHGAASRRRDGGSREEARPRGLGEEGAAHTRARVAISEDRLAGVFNLPTDGLTDLSEVLNHLVLQEMTVFSKSEKPVQYSCKKRLLKYEFRFLNDILAKSITVKAGSFDAVTHERFLMMTAIHFVVKINWSKILFEVLKEMADRTIKRAKGFAAQICVLLKVDPAVTFGDAKTFPPLKILSAKTVNTYVAMNKTIEARGETDEPDVATVAIVKKKSVSKKKYALTAAKDADDVHVEVVAEKAVSTK
ncbi:hypothetical protein F511_24661 [Dorcoceras hygrometricum]|uniref:Uncharacterized protein n=1 Tax=Dorcoceras hygrometricum TaxID=472368 RepID=A0A2Z7BTW3_9LAMI|nr:hypothetical protein F511_24661 [Dorcoceras hygrometricum]